MLANITYRQSIQDTLLSDTKFADAYIGTKPTDIAGISLGTKAGRITVGTGAFGATNSSGVATCDTTKLTDETNAPAGGTITYFVGLKNDGVTITGIWGAGAAGDKQSDGVTAIEIVLNNKTVAVGGTIHINSWTNTFAVGQI